MKCPACKTHPLVPTKLDDDLPVLGCKSCGGAIVSLLYYRDWAERTANVPVVAGKPDEDHPQCSESPSALSCPKCGKLMSKYAIAGSAKNKLDLCGTCDEAWLDGGEWELLKSLQLSKSIPAVFTDVWQRRVRKEISEARLIERFSKVLDEADLEKAQAVREWIKNHPKRTDILFLIGHL